MLYSAREPAARLRRTANTAAASPSTPTTSPATPSPRAVESLPDAVDLVLAEFLEPVGNGVVPLAPSSVSLAVSFRTGAGFSGS